MSTVLDEIDAIAQAAWERPMPRRSGAGVIAWLVLAIVLAPLLAAWVVAG